MPSGGDDDSSSFSLREQNLRFILGLKLHNLRQERGLSLVQLSQGCGLSVSYLNEIEKGKKYPKTDKLLALARALGVTYNELVSADPGEKLRPIAALLTTRMIDDLPLDHYGISPPVLMEIMAAGPDRLGAMLAFMRKLAVRFDFTVDDLLEASIRDDLENTGYHYPDLEAKAESLFAEIGWQPGSPPILSQLRFSLIHDFGWEVDEQRMGDDPDLADVGAATALSGAKPKLYLHPALPEGRRAFFIAKEIAATALGFYEKRRRMVSEVEKGFRQMQLAARAAYLGGALVAPRKTLVDDLRSFFDQPTFSGEHLLASVSRFGGDAEVVFHRIAQLLPDLGLPTRYLVRTEPAGPNGVATVNRELRLGGLPEVPGSFTPQGRSRTSAATRLLASAADGSALPLASAAIETCPYNGLSFLVVTVVQARPLHPRLASALSIGIPVDDTSRARIRFLQDPSLVAAAEASPTAEAVSTDRKAARRAAIGRLTSPSMR
jgi:transcriptional regulator with XRE-family HTH domain